MDCRLRLAQTNPSLGDLHGNLAAHEELASAASEDGIDLLLFPELSLTGYFLKDQTYDLALSLDAPELARIARLSERTTLGVGFVERAPEDRYYNAYALFEGGRLAHVHRKVHLVTYGMFDEARDLAAGESFAVAESRLGRIGVLLCEDMWHAPGPYLCFLENADLIAVPSAAPARGVNGDQARLASQVQWDRILGAAAFQFQTWVAYVNRVGWEDGVGFGGGTSCFDPFGERVAAVEGLATGTLDAAIARSALRRARVQTPLRRDEKPWILSRRLGEIGAGR